MVKAKNVVVWGLFGVLGYFAAKETMGGAASRPREHRRRQGRAGVANRLANGSLGKAEAYTDAFPEEGLGGLDGGR